MTDAREHAGTANSTDQAARLSVADALRTFARHLSDDHSVDDILAHLGNHCTGVLGVTGVGILLRDGDGGLLVATANSDLSRIVESLETELREGPCTTSMETGQQVTEPDLSLAHERYPRFVPRALGAGVKSVYGLPLTSRVEQIGALNAVHSDVCELTPQQLGDAQLLADVAMSYIVNRRMLDASTELARQLQHALDSRVLIEQAKGKLSERHRISVNDAFERIRSYARSNRLKVHDVAESVLSEALEL